MWEHLVRIMGNLGNRWSKWFWFAYRSEDWFISHKLPNLKSEEGIASITQYDWDAMTSHGRYPTSWNKNIWDAWLQPFTHTEMEKGWGFSFSFNWNIANSDDIASDLENQWYVFKLEGLDTEVLQAAIIREYDRGETDLKTIVENIMEIIDGACNISILDKDGNLIISSDKNGFHPLCWSIKDGFFVYASESSALEAIGCEEIYELGPGEIIQVINGRVLKDTMRDSIETKLTPCVFEKIYFSSPETIIWWKSIAKLRAAMWRKLAYEVSQNIEIDRGNSIVVPIPESSKHQADGFWQFLNIGNIPLIMKNPDADRTFLEQIEDIDEKIKEKYIFNEDPRLMEMVRVKEIFLVDDSIVRWKTMQWLIRVFTEIYKPKKVHLVSASPMVIAPCFYGINMPTISELLIPGMVDDVSKVSQQELREVAKPTGTQRGSWTFVMRLPSLFVSWRAFRCTVRWNSYWTNEGGVSLCCMSYMILSHWKMTRIIWWTKTSSVGCLFFYTSSIFLYPSFPSISTYMIVSFVPRTHSMRSLYCMKYWGLSS